ncbi:MAG TPA: hypothetical protein VHJ38_03740 [Nitrososphaeraceae archaeon]|nr:hypothetical protein [Nitrososphaeraceae archaeon]
MTTDDQLEDKNQYSTTTKKNSFDILDASIVEKLEKNGRIELANCCTYTDR